MGLGAGQVTFVKEKGEETGSGKDSNLRKKKKLKLLGGASLGRSVQAPDPTPTPGMFSHWLGVP